MNARQLAEYRDELARRIIAAQDQQRAEAHAAAAARTPKQQPVTARRQRRRDAWLRSSRKRFARYQQLRQAAGETHRDPWTAHLAELESRL